MPKITMSTRHGGNGGTIVNMSSLAALGSPNEYTHCAASKGAVETITAGKGKALAPEGIRVNAIRAGTTNTRIRLEGGNPERPAEIAAVTPMARIAEPEDIAQQHHGSHHRVPVSSPVPSSQWRADCDDGQKAYRPPQKLGGGTTRLMTSLT
ncbi:MAG TPA: SDR family oxidoreductase [Rhizobiaceae bacterium]|nr:SDR family oxidoreductase [Rhizobiaceae bacterium]